MPATLAGQLTLLLGICALVTYSYKAYKLQKKNIEERKLHDEWVEIMWLWFVRSTGKGSVPRYIAERHMEINGWSQLEPEEKRRLYGSDYDKPSGEIDMPDESRKA